MVVGSSDGGVGCLAIWGLEMEEALGRPFVITGLFYWDSDLL